MILTIVISSSITLTHMHTHTHSWTIYALATTPCRCYHNAQSVASDCVNVMLLMAYQRCQLVHSTRSHCPEAF